MFKKLFNNILIPVIRGAAKSVPLVGTGLEIAQNIAASKEGAAPEDLPHDWKSILFQIISVGAIIYAFATHAITIDQLLKFLNFTN